MQLISIGHSKEILDYFTGKKDGSECIKVEKRQTLEMKGRTKKIKKIKNLNKIIGK